MTTVRNDHLDLAAGRIDYTEFGPTDGPAVVFVHGFLVNQTVWGDIPQRLADAGLRCVVPTWPLGAHRHPMSQRADLSPRGVARLVIEFMDALRLTRVTMVGNDTGGAICQFVLDECGADGRLRPGMEALVERLVLTNCDAFDTFPPVPFTMLFALATRPRLARPLLRSMRWAPLRTSALGFGSLTARRLTAEETLPWVAPYLSVAGIALDVARFCGAVRPNELAAVTGRLAHFPGKSLLCWGAADRFFTPALGRRLAASFENAEFVDVPGARTFVALDQPQALADAILRFVAGATRSPVARR